MRLDEWVQRGEKLLRTGPHPDRARRDAEALLLHVVRRERAALLARWKEKLEDVEARQYAKLVKRRLTGEPMQYIFGETEFYGLPFRVSRDVLIPRPETEHLIEVLQTAASQAATLSLQATGRSQPRIVDVGTGSGAIAVTLAKKLPHAAVTAIDLSVKALIVARENAALNGVPVYAGGNDQPDEIQAGRVRFLQGDLLAPVAEERFEIVVSNPPYVPIGDGPTLSVEVRDYEPHLALFAGEDGMEVYRRLIPQARAVLVPGGLLALEIGYGQEAAVAWLLREHGFERIEFIPDLQGIPRIACATIFAGSSFAPFS